MDELASRKYPVQEHMRFQRRMWVIERIGWVVLALITLLALLGLFGTGILSKTSISGGSLTVEYDRFERRTHATEFTFRLTPTASMERRLRLNAAFPKDYEITSIQPPPARSAADGLDLIFTATPGRAADVVIWARPHTFGTTHIEVRADNDPPLRFWVMIYP